ncbi:hypothetical protein CLOM_g5879 [Closterium sp. NIES-68]|nr:hypothetical protein CLOM_g5879 [Closterium sp. NIES-68]
MEDAHLIVPSPTFLLLNSYHAATLMVHHYDAYRLADMRTHIPTLAMPRPQAAAAAAAASAAAAAAAAASPDIQRLDLTHSLATGLCLIEWPGPLLPLLPAHRLHLSISLLPPTPDLLAGTSGLDGRQRGLIGAEAEGGAAEGEAETGEVVVGGEGREDEWDEQEGEDGEEWEEQEGWDEEQWRVVHLDARGERWAAVVDGVLAIAPSSNLVTLL